MLKKLYCPDRGERKKSKVIYDLVTCVSLCEHMGSTPWETVVRGFPHYNKSVQNKDKYRPYSTEYNFNTFFLIFCHVLYTVFTTLK